MLTGGGSGGHITPILAVAHELKSLSPDHKVVVVGQHDDGLLDVVRGHKAVDAVETVSAGKLRRYSGEGWKQFLDIPTQLLNIRDVFRTLAGIWQSYRLLGKLRPEVVFTRGGYVSVPVALAARLRHIPYITHDSDSVPSLANRIIASGAALHAVAMNPNAYPYPPDSTVQTGVPVGHEYTPMKSDDVKEYRKKLGIDMYQHVLLVTGGGNGARALNRAVVDNTRYLLTTYPELAVLHFAGRELLDETNQAYDALNLGGARDRIKVFGFTTDFYLYTGAADIIIARGGATNIAEFAVQRKACILVPSKQLSWNVENSRQLAKQGAVVELSEDHAEQPERLGRLVGELLESAARREELASQLAKIGHPEAAREIATHIVQIGEGS